MSLQKTEIANLALGRIGATLQIVSLDTDNSTQAKVLRQHFNTSLKTLLGKHAWGFATDYAALDLVEENPVGGYAFLYRPPSDCLMIRAIAPSGVDMRDMDQYADEQVHWEESYDANGPLVRSDVGDAVAKFTKDVSPDIKFPDHFGRALAAQLSMDIAPQLITNNFPKVKEALNNSAENDISQGIALDISRKPPTQNSDSIFIRARL